MPTAAIADELVGPSADLRSVAARQRAELDAQMAALGALRHRFERLVDGEPDNMESPTAVIRAMQQLARTPFAVRHALALLPYPDLEEALRRLVEMFGSEAGSIERDAHGVAVHASVLAGTKAAMEARLCSISSVDDGRIGLDRGWRAAKQWPGGTLVRARPDEAVALEDGLQRVPGQRIGFPRELQEAGAARGRGQPLGDVDEQAAAGLGHGRGGRQLPEGKPQGLLGGGHHLLVTDEE